MPPHRFHDAVAVLRQLPGQSALAQSRRRADEDESRAALAPGGVEQVLEQTHLVVASDERGLEGVRPVLAAELGDDPGRPPGLNRARFTLEHVLSGWLVRDRASGRALRRLPDEDGPRRGYPLKPRGRVDEITR